jgi:alpha-tubulin suppressor-like RCC1 family protein
LGLGDNIPRTSISVIPTLSNIIKISSKRQHTLALGNEGKVYAFGRNLVCSIYNFQNGQLGTKDYNIRNTPTKIETLENIIDVSCGSSHSVVLRNDGKVFSFGDNGVKFIIKIRMVNLVLVTRLIETPQL